MPLSPEYAHVQARLATGWNTWDVHSMTRHVLLPQGLCVSLGFKDYATGKFLPAALTGRHGEEVETVRPGARTYDGRYTNLTLEWSGVYVRIESSANARDLIIIVTPLSAPHAGLRRKALIICVGFLWNYAGMVSREKDDFIAVSGDNVSARVTCDAPRVIDRNVPVSGQFAVIPINENPITICAGRNRTFTESRSVLDDARDHMVADNKRLCLTNPPVAEAVKSALAWDTIFDPDGQRVISPVSRVWSSNQGGWVLFCWDTYFAALLAAATGNRELAYANLVEITRHATDAGFVPNTTNGHGFVTRDRSQPPVGSFALLELYRRYGERWIVELLFDALLKWNRWWPVARGAGRALAWGSNAYNPVVGNEWESAEKGVGQRFGAALESGMDNSPAYDGVEYDRSTSALALQDVGLTSLYAVDCEALAELALAIGRLDAREELLLRLKHFGEAVQGLWCEELRIFACRSTVTGQFNARLTPANFYPWLVKGLVTPQQTQQMLERYINDPQFFGGDWLIPSCPRSDPAFPEQHYWRGRIWPPHVYLVWLGLYRSGQTDAADRLKANAAAILQSEWNLHGHVHENYCANTGQGCGYRWSDPLYHWGGLLGLPVLM